MAQKKKNRPQRPGSQPVAVQTNGGGGGGGGGGNNNRNNRPNNRPKNNRNGGGGGGGGGGGTGAVTTPGFDYGGISADPGAWMRGQMSQAGFDISANSPYTSFLNAQVVDPFVQGWQTYTTNNTGQNVSIADYIGGYGWGADPYQAGQKTAPDMTHFLSYLQSVIDRHSNEQKGIYDPGKDRGSMRWSVYT